MRGGPSPRRRGRARAGRAPAAVRRGGGGGLRRHHLAGVASLGAGAWSDSPVQVGLLMVSRCEVRFGVTATARERPRVHCAARDGTQIPLS